MGERGLSRPRRPVQDERRKVITFDRPPQHTPGADQVLLADEFIQGPGPHPGGQRRLGRGLTGSTLSEQLHRFLLAGRRSPAASMVAQLNPSEPGTARDRVWIGKSYLRWADEAGNSDLARKSRIRTNSTLPQEGSQWPNR